MTVLKTTFDRYEPCIDELEIYSTAPDRRNVALASSGATSAASGTYPNSTIHRLEHINDAQYGNERSWISNEIGHGWVEITFAQPETIDVVVWGRDRDEKYRDRLIERYRIEVCDESGVWTPVSTSDDREPWPGEAAPPKLVSDLGLSPEQKSDFDTARAELATLETRIQSLTTLPRVYAGRFETPAPSFLLNRGDATQPREQVPPASVHGLGPELTLPLDTPEQDRRLALANWLSDPRNPLPARVLVNRLWLHHFGEGLVSTPNDFGHNGASPSHPELLDWLASEFLRSGGRIKSLQRLIVTSATWKQAASPRPRALSVDAQCRLLWRYPQRRLESEMIRDAMLQAAGTLDLRMGGPGFSVFAPNNNYVRVYDPKPEFGPPEWRRAIYMTKVRVAQDFTFGAFDCPDAGQSQPKRPRSTTPLQALNLFNSEFVLQQAKILADRVRSETGDDPSQQINHAFRLVLARAPTDAEHSVCLTLARSQGLEAVGRILFNTNEFLFIP